MADDSKDGSEKDRNAPTVRDLAPRALSTDTVPDVVGQYAPPRPLPEATQHRTLDLRSVRVREYDDPRRAPTELRLMSPPRAPVRSSAWLLWGGLALLVAGSAWLVFRAFVAPPEVAPSPAPVEAEPASVVEAPSVNSATPDVTPLAPVASPASEPAGSGEPSPGPAETATTSTAVPKPKAPSGSEKKRREPWLE